MGSEPKLSDAEIAESLKMVPEWSELGEAIQRTFAFENFVVAMQFVERVAQAAESDAHHPDILIRYNKVTMTLSTHDAGGITAKDFAAAAKYDSLATGLPGPVAKPASKPAAKKPRKDDGG